jgi:hypothetical protein
VHIGALTVLENLSIRYSEATDKGIASLASLTKLKRLDVRGVEEPHLRRQFGELYETYAAQTGRFLPRLGRLSTQ